MGNSWKRDAEDRVRQIEEGVHRADVRIDRLLAAVSAADATVVLESMKEIAGLQTVLADLSASAEALRALLRRHAGETPGESVEI